MQTVPRTTNADSHAEPGASSRPPAGSPKLAKTARPATTIAAPRMWRRVIVWFVKKYPSGIAQMTAVTSSGWMMATRPRSRAAA